MIQRMKWAASRGKNPKELLRFALCLSSLAASATAAPPSEDVDSSFGGAPTLVEPQIRDLCTKPPPGFACKTKIATDRSSWGELCGRVTRLVGVAKREAALAALDDDLIPKSSWLDAALAEKLRLDSQPDPALDPAGSTTGALPTTADTLLVKPHFVNAAATSAAENIGLPQAPAPDTHSETTRPTTIVEVAEAIVESPALENESLVDVAIPDLFGSSESSTFSSGGVASLGQTPSGAGAPNVDAAGQSPTAELVDGAPAMRMRIGEVKPLLAAGPSPLLATTDPSVRQAPTIGGVAANPVVIAVGDTAKPSTTFRLNDVPIDPAGVVAHPKVALRGTANDRSGPIENIESPTKSALDSTQAPSRIRPQGSLLSSGTGAGISIRIGANGDSGGATSAEAERHTHRERSVVQNAISDRAVERNTIAVREPVVQAVLPARHTISDERSDAYHGQESTELFAIESDDNPPDQVDVQVRNFKSLDLDGSIVEIFVEDDSVCQVLKTGKQSLSLIGLMAGTTRVAIVQDISGERAKKIFAIQVAGTSDSAASVTQLAQELTRTLRSLYPGGKIDVLAGRQELTVRGLASSEEEAQAILSFVRRTTLRPVVDRVVTRR